MSKQQIRSAFRNSVFKRDGYKCVCCGLKANIENSEEVLDAHHVQNRNLFKNGGYVKENGVSLCKGNKGTDCHWKAEQFYITGISLPGYSPEDLFKKIGSSFEKALKADEKL